MEIGVITGDIVSSHKLEDRSIWLNKLKAIFNDLDANFLQLSDQWDIFRGDSFQLRVQQPEQTLKIALLIRAGLKSLEVFTKNKMNVRIAIGIGSEEFKGDNIREADGTAYQNSGKLLDSIIEKQILLALKSPWKDFDEEMQVSFALAEVLINGWSYKSAEIAWWMLRGETTQKELSNILKISQPAVHKRIQRVYYDELKMLEWRFRNKIIKLNK